MTTIEIPVTKGRGMLPVVALRNEIVRDMPNKVLLAELARRLEWGEK